MLKHRFQRAKAGLGSVRRQAQRVGDELRERLRTASANAPASPTQKADTAAASESAPSETNLRAPLGDSEALQSQPDEPPVVARLMVEIRSDGTRTIARGAIQDQLSGEQVSLVAQGNSPLELAGQLLKSLMTTPLMAGDLAKAMLKARRSSKS